jgi:sorting nexin-4
MPVGEDNFSNISWHSEQNAERVGSSTSASHNPVGSPGFSSHQSDDTRTDDGRDADYGHSAGEILECTVAEPHKENDGTKDTYVSYLITTNVG